MKILLLALAGVAGTLSRFWLNALVQRAHGGSFPWGTFAVNMIGCLAFGLVWTLAEERLTISVQTKAILLVGFMGAFTTFSSFVFETGQLMRESQWALALGNIMLQNLTGVVFLFAGIYLARLL